MQFCMYLLQIPLSTVKKIVTIVSMVYCISSSIGYSVGSLGAGYVLGCFLGGAVGPVL